MPFGRELKQELATTTRNFTNNAYAGQEPFINGCHSQTLSCVFLICFRPCFAAPLQDVAKINDGKPPLYQDDTDKKILGALEMLNGLDGDAVDAKRLQHPQAEMIEQEWVSASGLTLKRVFFFGWCRVCFFFLLGIFIVCLISMRQLRDRVKKLREDSDSIYHLVRTEGTPTVNWGNVMDEKLVGIACVM